MNLDRRQFLQSAGAAIAAAPALLGQRPRRPNVLVVLADEWRAQATGYNGDRNVSAPVLDRLVNLANLRCFAGAGEPADTWSRFGKGSGLTLILPAARALTVPATAGA